MAVSLTTTRLATRTIPTSADIVYTAPDDANVRIDDASLFNAAPSTVTYTFWVPEGGSPSDGNVLVKDLTLDTHDREEFSALQGVVVNAGWSIYAVCDTANVLTLTISGTEIRQT